MPGRPGLDEARHRIDIAAPLADPLHPPDHPFRGVRCQDGPGPRRVVERHIAADHHVEQLSPARAAQAKVGAAHLVGQLAVLLVNLGQRLHVVAGEGDRHGEGVATVFRPQLGARLANVSQSAVSRSFNENGKVLAETRAKVLAAARTLGYTPNVMARSLITWRTNMIGLVMADITNPSYPNVLEKFTLRLREMGQQVLLFTVPPDHDADALLPSLLEYQVDAVIITSVLPETGQHHGALRRPLSVEPQVTRGAGRGSPACHPQLAEHTGDVVFGGVNADDEGRGDVGIAGAPGKEPQHLDLTGTQQLACRRDGEATFWRGACSRRGLAKQRECGPGAPRFHAVLHRKLESRR